jgi:hypothetical protein
MREIAKDGDMFFVTERAAALPAPSTTNTNSASMPSYSVFFPSMPFTGFDRQLNDLMTWVNPGPSRPQHNHPHQSAGQGYVDPLSASGKKICTCRNSKCIKLYCMCFAGGECPAHPSAIESLSCHEE